MVPPVFHRSRKCVIYERKHGFCTSGSSGTVPEATGTRDGRKDNKLSIPDGIYTRAASRYPYSFRHPVIPCLRSPTANPWRVAGARGIRRKEKKQEKIKAGEEDKRGRIGREGLSVPGAGERWGKAPGVCSPRSLRAVRGYLTVWTG